MKTSQSIQWNQTPYIEITHKPTGVKVRSQQQHRSSLTRAKDAAMKMLRSIITFGWASDEKMVVRKYDLSTARIKDVRSSHEVIGNVAVAKVLDGDLDGFILAAHRAQSNQT